MKRTIVALGGGELKTKTTLQIDEYLAGLAKAHAGENRAYALFLPTASHDSMPYFNSFRKIYTSVFDIKADVALTVYGEMDYEKIAGKIAKADLIYAGGGDTKYMIDTWREKGLLPLILDAYQRGVPIAGLSAGAICWFQTMYTDYNIVRGASNEYDILSGLGVLNGAVSPHYNLRKAEFDPIVQTNGYSPAYGVEDNAALVFENEMLVGSLTAGGTAYSLTVENGKTVVTPVPTLKKI